MARKKKKNKHNAIFWLAIMALFAMMIPMFTLANSNQNVTTSQAASESR